MTMWELDTSAVLNNHKISNLNFADDIAAAFESVTDLQEIENNIVRKVEEWLRKSTSIKRKYDTFDWRRRKSKSGSANAN